MNATNRYLNELKVKTGLTSDYALSGVLKVTRSAVSAYRTKNVSFDEETSVRVASILGIDPVLILAEIHAEKAKSDQTRAVWSGLLEKVSKMAAVCLFATVIFMGDTGRAYAASGVDTINEYTLCEIFDLYGNATRYILKINRYLQHLL